MTRWNVRTAIQPTGQWPTVADAVADRAACDPRLQCTFARAMGEGGEQEQRRQPPSEELTALLERWCADMYVGERSRAANPRLLLQLDGPLAGVSAEIVREGASLRVRLRTRSMEAYERMQARRAALVEGLAGHAGNVPVSIEIILDDGVGSGRAD